MHGTPVDVDIFGTADPVAPLLRARVHAGVKIRVEEDDGVGVEHLTHGRAAAIGQNGAEESSVAVKRPHLLLNTGGTLDLLKCLPHLFTIYLHLFTICLQV